MTTGTAMQRSGSSSRRRYPKERTTWNGVIKRTPIAPPMRIRSGSTTSPSNPRMLCNDGNGCTVGYQGEESCVFCQEPLENMACSNEGVDCRETSGICHSGQCDSAFLPVDTPCSNDGNPCTVDLCDASGDCQHGAGPEGVACENDRNDCTQDQCDDAGQCQHEPISLGAECALGFDTCGSGSLRRNLPGDIFPTMASPAAHDSGAPNRGARLPTYDEWLAHARCGLDTPEYILSNHDRGWLPEL